MSQLHPSRRVHAALTLLIGSVWIFHGMFSKISDGIPRHRLIVGRILGDGIADTATLAIGMMEVALGIWIFSRIWRRMSAAVQTAAIVAMNSLEILLARDLLVSAWGMVALNLAFLSVVWYWALAPGIGKSIDRPPTGLQ